MLPGSKPSGHSGLAKVGKEGKPSHEGRGPGVLDNVLVVIIYSGPEIEDKLLVQLDTFRRDFGGSRGINEIVCLGSHEEHLHTRLEVHPVVGSKLGDLCGESSHIRRDGEERHGNDDVKREREVEIKRESQMILMGLLKRRAHNLSKRGERGGHKWIHKGETQKGDTEGDTEGDTNGRVTKGGEFSIDQKVELSLYT